MGKAHAGAKARYFAYRPYIDMIYSKFMDMIYLKTAPGHGCRVSISIRARKNVLRWGALSFAFLSTLCIFIDAATKGSIVKIPRTTKDNPPDRRNECCPNCCLPVERPFVSTYLPGRIGIIGYARLVSLAGPVDFSGY